LFLSGDGQKSIAPTYLIIIIYIYYNVRQGDESAIMSLAIDFWRLMHYIALMGNNWCGRSGSLSGEASRSRFDAIDKNGFCGGLHGRRLQPV
jgi:hypothetical protein